MEGEMHRTRPGGLNGGEMYGTRAGLPILLLLSDFGPFRGYISETVQDRR